MYIVDDLLVPRVGSICTCARTHARIHAYSSSSANKIGTSCQGAQCGGLAGSTPTVWWLLYLEPVLRKYYMLDIISLGLVAMLGEGGQISLS